MIVYHNSNHLFTRPNYDLIVANRTNHGNGELGLWFSTTNDWQKGFGKYKYQIAVPNEGCHAIDAMAFRDLCNAEEGTEYYKLWRERLLAKGYTHIRIYESDGSFDMGIIIDFTKIRMRRIDE